MRLFYVFYVCMRVCVGVCVQGKLAFQKRNSYQTGNFLQTKKDRTFCCLNKIKTTKILFFTNKLKNFITISI